MISREILKKIRQIEIRTNRLVTESLATFSLQPPMQFGGIPGAMENGNDANETGLNGKINVVTIKNFHPCFTNRFANKRKPFGVLKNSSKNSVNFRLKPFSQAHLLNFIPENSIFELQPCFRVKNYFAGHARRCAIRPFSSARTFSQVTPSSGLQRSHSARCSNRATISGGNSSLNSASINWTSSHCSEKGIRRNCSRISVALMPIKLTSPNHFASA